MRDDFGILIMSYGRPGNVVSLNTLLKQGYTGKWFIVIGDDDPKKNEYRHLFGERVVMFCKADYIASTDRMGLKITKVICFARNACFDIAESLGLKFFQQFDDDYTGFFFAANNKLEYVNCNAANKIESYDRAIANLLCFYESTPRNCLAIAFAQGGDFLGGTGTNDCNLMRFSILRKAMNSWLCSTERRFSFSGCMNEDASAYTSLQSQGYLFLTISQYRLEQPVTQSTGGMTAIYKQYGTHVKSFLTVMRNPSFVKVGLIKGVHQRLHHRINWERCAAKIIRDTHKKRE